MANWAMVEDYYEENKHLTLNQMKIKEVKKYLEVLDRRIQAGEEAKKKKSEWQDYLKTLEDKEK